MCRDSTAIFWGNKTPGINRAFLYQTSSRNRLPSPGISSFSWNASRLTPKPSYQRHSTMPLE
ncbi:hypothetical protein CKO_00987 [Citrobacter koseri ATCC BAA-895]|uniref:Uncharacterized protein n=1 Tax=Citrobacter koseri (strain ATCC BAA-895 / CDC 4225-83 / SGSC4696) TaxID=290338 RepID=A8AF71_CITK8|nr:hypothetical protein CKO_00987 [Citrobacter koseri ATCC BAA-895]